MITFLEYVNGKRQVVTMDFDHNLKFETGKPNEETIRKFKELQDDFDVYIVTTRNESQVSKREIVEFLNDNGLKVKEIIHTNGELKLKTIVDLNSEMHFDDDEKELEKIEQYNKNNEKNIKTIYTFNEKAWKEYLKQIDYE